MEVIIHCDNQEEAKRCRKAVLEFARKIKRIRGGELSYCATIVSCEYGRALIMRTKVRTKDRTLSK